ncbi:MAG: hypothetical protein U5L45_20145 [Saprospiraceae bacterium]|nr:hypothetical protein [Saprospiraceae bacterium]
MLLRSLRSRKERLGRSFFGLCPKNERHSSFSRERSEREKECLNFMYCFKKINVIT